jgi:hypothetical protein
MTSTLIPDTVAAVFTDADRCDRCGARAISRVTFTGGGELYFCGHHTRRYDEALRSVDAEVVVSV